MTLPSDTMSQLHSLLLVPIAERCFRCNHESAYIVWLKRGRGALTVVINNSAATFNCLPHVDDAVCWATTF
jgi:hypothetical protein